MLDIPCIVNFCWMENFGRLPTFIDITTTIDGYNF